MFSYAVRQQYIDRSPCENAVLPDDRRKTAVSHGSDTCSADDLHMRKYITEDELPEFLSFFSGQDPVNTMILTLLYTGMRVGEMLALTWNDIDFNTSRVRISKSLSYVNGNYIISSPKTASSIRTVCMSCTLKNILLQHQKYQKKFIRSVSLNEKYRRSVHKELVFTSEKGLYKSKTALNKQFKKKLVHTRFSHLTLHCLRHINATLLLNSGVDLKIVSEHLGHSSISTTADIYTDVLESTKEKTAGIIDDKIESSLSPSLLEAPLS